MVTSALKWIGGSDGYLELVDQRQLPGDFIVVRCDQIEEVYEAISSLAVRGAPAIGVAAAYGVVLGLRKLGSEAEKDEALWQLSQCCEYLGSSRPTAVNLFRALERAKRSGLEILASEAAGVKELKEAVWAEAQEICREDIEMCERIGANGQRLIKDGDVILTHCNAGALATAGQGTALSIMFEAKRRGRRLKVYADETRPLLQGSRLTAWELKEAGIEVVVICDNMAGWLMKEGKISAVITGADRIAANGDAANKIGSYSLSILAKYHKIPFYIAAPSSTFDLNIKDGTEIPIEQRPREEVALLGSKKVVPDGVEIFNPAFDVVLAENITAIITERGVIKKPDAKKIADHLT